MPDYGPIDVYWKPQGSAYADDFAYYAIGATSAGARSLRGGWVKLFESSTPVRFGQLFEWNTNTVENGDYRIQLVVVLKDGSALAPCTKTVVVVH